MPTTQTHSEFMREMVERLQRINEQMLRNQALLDEILEARGLKAPKRPNLALVKDGNEDGDDA